MGMFIMMVIIGGGLFFYIEIKKIKGKDTLFSGKKSKGRNKNTKDFSWWKEKIKLKIKKLVDFFRDLF